MTAGNGSNREPRDSARHDRADDGAHRRAAAWLRRPMRLATVLGLLVAMTAFAACGGSSSNDSSAPKSTAATATPAPKAQDVAALAAKPVEGPLPPNIDLVPEAARKNYVGYQFLEAGMKLEKSPYANWKAPKPPWKLCYSAITQQNSWHVEAMKMWKMLGLQLKQEGVVSDVVTTNSDGNTGQQISQINGMVSQGCSAIAAITPSATALCPAFKNAFDKGVLIFSAEGSVNCPGIGQAVQPNDYIDGVKSMQWLAGAMGGKGNVLLLQGMPSYPLSAARLQGAKDALKAYPNIKILDVIVTEWNAATAKTKLLQWLASHPTKVDGVWQEGCCGDITSVDALKQTGRPPAIVNGWGGSAAWLSFWKANKLDSFDLLQGGPSQAVNYFDIMVRMLSGEKPKVNNLVHTVTFFGNDELGKYAQPWMTTKSTGFVMPPGSRSVPTEYWDPFFTKGTMPVPKYDPTKYDASKG
jgi:ribose transport system substrate-binding protein